MVRAASAASLRPGSSTTISSFPFLVTVGSATPRGPMARFCIRLTSRVWIAGICACCSFVFSFDVSIL